MKFVYNDGGRKEAGHWGKAMDCVARAVTIASGLSYEEVYNKLAEGNATQRKSSKKYKKANKRPGFKQKTADYGISTRRKWFDDYMTSVGFTWVPTMKIGSGCTVHLRDGELPNGRLVVNVSRHFVAVIDGVINDIFDPSREGTRCVYGYYIFNL